MFIEFCFLLQHERADALLCQSHRQRETDGASAYDQHRGICHQMNSKLL